MFGDISLCYHCEETTVCQFQDVILIMSLHGLNLFSVLYVRGSAMRTIGVDYFDKPLENNAVFPDFNVATFFFRFLLFSMFHKLQDPLSNDSFQVPEAS